VSTDPTRRAVMAGAMAAAACGAPGGEPVSRLPVVYLPHGGGPWPFVDLGFPKAELDALRRYLEGLPGSLGAAPRAILCVSAHWEEAVPTVTTAENPGMVYDYYGFPPAAYEVVWAAPGAPAVARRVRELLAAAGVSSAEAPTRGYDHGTFVPLKVAWPGAEVPCVQLSLVKGLDPAAHLRLGRALAPLRDEGVFVVGSGMSFHDMRGFGTRAGSEASVVFDEWLGRTVADEPAARDAALERWATAPAARRCHPREEHLLPLHVIAGAAGVDRGEVTWRDRVLGTLVSAVRFG
jgi:aromatic ring-opening dioxygenase catalytic subunit (LigB family)